MAVVTMQQHCCHHPARQQWQYVLHHYELFVWHLDAIGYYHAIDLVNVVENAFLVEYSMLI